MRTCSRRTAFTLVELLVSMTLLVIIMLLLVSLTNATQRIWTKTTAQTDAFRSARTGFEAMTRRLSQTTLNSYLDYDNNPAVTTSYPQHYVRRSELRFITGAASSLVGTARGGTHPTHAMFFQAPLGFFVDTNYYGMVSLLNTFGYFVEVADDSATRPAFLTTLTPAIPLHTRFRLWELCEPAEKLTIYTKTSGYLTPGNTGYIPATPGYNATDWFTTPLQTPAYSHVLADNVVALVLLPKLSTTDDPTGTELAPNYTYSTAPVAWPPVYPQSIRENQLPPLVQVTMVAIDETSAARLATLAGSTDPATKLGLSNLFATAGSLTDATQPGYAMDLNTLTTSLQGLGLSYRVFSSEITIRDAKWSAVYK